MVERQNALDLKALGFPRAPKIHWVACEGVTPGLDTSTSGPSVTWSNSGGAESENSGSPTATTESGAPENRSDSGPSVSPSTSTSSPLSTTTNPVTSVPRPTSPVPPTEESKETAAGLHAGYPATIGTVVFVAIVSCLVAAVIWYVRF